MKGVTQQEIVRALRDCLGGIEYIQQSYGRLYGVGWERLKGYEPLLSRIEQHGITPPDGMVLVPKVPTVEMIEAAIKNGYEGDERIYEYATSDYKAMLAAAPEVKP